MQCLQQEGEVSEKQVRKISSIQRLSVTQLNSEEPFVAPVMLVADAGKAAAREEVLDNSGGGGQGITPGLLLAAGTTALAESVKRILARHNIGRNTVGIVRPQDDAPRGAVGSLEEEARGKRAAGVALSGERFASADESRRSAHDEAERGQVGAGGGWQESGGKSHGGHSRQAHGHGQCSGHGDSDAQAVSADLV